MGSWKNVGSGRGSISKDITVGVTTTKETSSSETITNTLTVSMESGFAFGSASMSDTLTTSNMKATRDVLEQSKTTVTKINCDAAKTKKPNQAVSLWQWVVSSNDGSVTASTEQFVCKIGAGWDKAPICPFGACNNA